MRAFGTPVCFFMGVKPDVGIAAVAKVIQAQFQNSAIEANQQARQLKFGESIEFEFSTYEEMVEFAAKMEAVGVENVDMSDDPAVDEDQARIDFADLLTKAAEFEIYFDAINGFATIWNPITQTPINIEHTFTSQFIANELVRLGAIVKLEMFPETK